MKLGKAWRNRINNEYPEANVIIVLHREYGEWFLDTYNHPVYFDDAVYL